MAWYVQFVRFMSIIPDDRTINCNYCGRLICLKGIGNRCLYCDNDCQLGALRKRRRAKDPKQKSKQRKQWPSQSREGRKLERHKYGLRVRYGMSAGEYQQRLVDQNGGCAICGQLPGKKRLSVDHNHITKQARGLLCQKCNNHVGFVENAPKLQEAQAYLASWAAKWAA